MEIDLSNPFKNLTSIERQYVETLVNDSKLNEAELIAKFGDNLPRLRSNLDLRRISAEIKLERGSRKHLVDNFKLEQTVQLIPLALATIVDIMENGKEHNRLAAAQTILRPSIAYLERLGVNVSSIEIVDSSGNDKQIKIYIDEQDKAL